MGIGQSGRTLELTRDLQREICSLFEVYSDEGGVQRVVTPLEYSGSGDHVVIRVRPNSSGGYQIDENGEAALYASMGGGDLDSEVVARWAEELQPPVVFDDMEVIRANAEEARLIAPYIFRVAEAAQRLQAITTVRAERQQSDIKERVAAVIRQVAAELGRTARVDVQLPIAGGMQADHVVDLDRPLIVIVATSAARLLEAEVIHMQYRMEKRPGLVLAVAESQAAVGRKQFERAGYYTAKTVVYDEDAFPQLLTEWAGA